MSEKMKVVSGTPDQAERALKKTSSEPPPRPEKRAPRVFAGPCPRSPETHQNTRVYRTVGRTRYCVCDDCGETWKQADQPAGEVADYLVNLAESLDKAPRAKVDDGEIVAIPDTDAKQISADLRRLAAM